MRIAFVTDYNHPHCTEDDSLLNSFLENKGIQVVPTIWNDDSIKWISFDMVIIRSPWDYFYEDNAFKKWLSKIDALGLDVYNPTSLIRWNMDKKYLVELRDKNFLIPEFELIEKNNPIELAEVFEKYNWTEAVLKPTISAGAYKTIRIHKNDVETGQSYLNEVIKERSFLIQKFSTEIEENGEISILFFNKQYSHAVVKKAKEGDFRVQSEYGGSSQYFNPSDELLQQVIPLMQFLPEPVLYARVDGFLNHTNTFFLMEIELIEPILFFNEYKQGIENFYNALIELHTLT